MNKQEAIEKIKSKKSVENCLSNYGLGYNEALDEAIHTINQINAPEKPVLTKEEAEWVDKLNESFNLPDALYYITRSDYGYLFKFEMCGKTYELPFDSHATYGEMRKLKERLVNAVLYGYEVEKEKLYTVEIPIANSPLGYHYVLRKTTSGEIIIDSFFTNNWGDYDYCQLTEAEIKKDHDWAWRYAKEV